MLIHPGNYIGDTWYYVDNDTIHCFYLTCPNTIERHTSWDIAHATSTNLTDWTLHGVILRKGEPDAYDGRCPATGSVIRFKDRYWLAYTGNWNGPQPVAAMARARPASPSVCRRPRKNVFSSGVPFSLTATSSTELQAKPAGRMKALS